MNELVRRTLESEGFSNAMVSVTFVGETTIAKLNSRYLRHSGATDVITFGFDRDSKTSPIVGDVYICPRVAARNARRLRIPLREELSRLVVHGSLHLAGFEHPDDDRRMNSPMWRKQERIVDRHG